MADLHRVRSPFLLVVSELDINTPIRFAHVLANEIRGERLEVVPETAHRLRIETPERFNAIVLNLLSRIEEGRTGSDR